MSPRTLLVGPLRELTGLVAVAAGAFAVGGASMGLLIAALATVLGAVFHALNWATFTYRVAGDRIELRRELIGRSVRTIPLDRIRGVDITAPFLHRLLGLAVVRIDAAVGGVGTQEGKLDAVRYEEAERLRLVLLGRRLEGAPAAAGEPSGAGPHDPYARPAERSPGPARGTAGAVAPGTADEELYARARRRWYLYGPLSGAFLLTPFAVAGSVLGFLYNLGDELGLVTERRLTSLADWLAHSPGMIIGALGALLVLTPVVAVLAFAVFNWDFTLRRRGGSIVTERGLFTRRSVSLEGRRVRGVELRDNPLERRARVARLNALVTGLGEASTRGQLLPTSPLEVALRAASRVLTRSGAGRAADLRASGAEETGGGTPGAGATGSGAPGVEPVAADAAGELPPAAVPLVRHPAGARRRRLFRAVVPWLAGAALAALLHRPVVAYVLLALAVVGVPLGLDRYRQLGHGDDGARTTVRSGSLSRRRVVVEHDAVVGWQVRQSLFQRRLGVATLVIGVGAGEGGYRAIDMAEPDTAPLMRRVTPGWVVPFIADQAGGARDADGADPAGGAGSFGAAERPHTP